MVKNREHNRKTCYPHCNTFLSSQISLYHLDCAIKSLFARINPYTTAHIKPGTLRKWLHPLSFIIPLDWISATCLSDPLLHRDTQRNYSMSWVHSEIEHPRHRNTEGMNSTDPRRKKKKIKKSHLLQLFEAPSDLVVSADGAIAVFTMDCKLGQFCLFKGKKPAYSEDNFKRILGCIQASVCHLGNYMLF